MLFIDDVNMPRRVNLAPNLQSSAAAARQAEPTLPARRRGKSRFCGGGGFYDKKHTWSSIEDLVMIAACAPPGSGRNK